MFLIVETSQAKSVVLTRRTSHHESTLRRSQVRRTFMTFQLPDRATPSSPSIFPSHDQPLNSFDDCLTPPIRDDTII